MAGNLVAVEAASGSLSEQVATTSTRAEWIAADSWMVLAGVQVQVASNNSVAATAAHDTAVAVDAAQYGSMLRLSLERPCAVPEWLPVLVVEVGTAPMEPARGLALRVPKEEPGRVSSVRFLQH